MAMRDKNTAVRKAAFWALEMIERRVGDSAAREATNDDAKVIQAHAPPPPLFRSIRKYKGIFENNLP
jgi:hypothetical protein